MSIGEDFVSEAAVVTNEADVGFKFRDVDAEREDVIGMLRGHAMLGCGAGPGLHYSGSSHTEERLRIPFGLVRRTHRVWQRELI